MPIETPLTPPDPNLENIFSKTPLGQIQEDTLIRVASLDPQPTFQVGKDTTILTNHGWMVIRYPDKKIMASGLTEDQAQLLTQGYRTFGPDSCLPVPGSRVIPRRSDFIITDPPPPTNNEEELTPEARETSSVVIVHKPSKFLVAAIALVLFLLATSTLISLFLAIF